MRDDYETRPKTHRAHDFWPPNLRTKFALGILLLGIVLAAATLSITYISYRNANLQKYQRIVASSAQMAASIVDGDDVERYLATRQGDEKYYETDKLLQNILDYYDLTYLYVYMPYLEEKCAAFAFNIARAEDEISLYKDVGMIAHYEPTEGDASVQLVQNVIDMKEPNLELNLSQSFNGWLASAFVPLLNSAGEVVAVVGADVSVNEVYAELSRIMLAISVTILLIMALSIFAYQSYFTRTMIRPLQALVDSAQSFVYNEFGEASLGAEPVNVNTRDELERLADAFNQMSDDIIHYIKDVALNAGENERVAAERSVAARIQRSVLPGRCDIPHDNRFRLCAAIDPAREVGGDFYDYFMLDDTHLCVVIGDVSGRGVPAALFMMAAKSAVRDGMLRGMEPGEAFTSANRKLCRTNEEGLHVAALSIVLDTATGEMTVLSAGHASPVLIRADGPIEWIETERGLVMGGVDGVRYRTTGARMHPGDAVFLFTDGVSGAVNNAKEPFGSDRIELSIRKNWKNDPEALVRGVRTDLIIFADGAEPSDDITMIAMQYRQDEEG